MRQSSLKENDKGNLSESGAETGNRNLESKFIFPDITIAQNTGTDLDRLALSPSETSLNYQGGFSVLKKSETKQNEKTTSNDTAETK